MASHPWCEAASGGIAASCDLTQDRLHHVS